MNLESATTSLLKKGYLDLPIPEEIDLVSEIKRLKKEKNAVLMAHYYQDKSIQD